MRKKIAFICLVSLVSVLMSCDTLNQAASTVLTQQGGIGGVLGNATHPSTTEMSSGLKQALNIGVQTGIQLLSKQNGFLGNNAVKLLFPPEAIKIEKALRSIGLNQLCDNVTTSLNRAAENAVKEAAPIFTDAIKQMSFADVTNILLSGQKDAATHYFKQATLNQLTQKFSPIISKSLNSVGATKYWTDVAAKYNTIPFVKPVDTDLTGYVTQKAIDGLFYQIAQEELKIRTNAAARSTTLLQKVFAYADKNI